MAIHTQIRSIHCLAASLVLLLMALGWLPSAAAANAAAPITVPFDHLTTGFELDGVHRDLPCESCHLNAVFYGTPRDCGSCHTTGSQFNATPKTATHIPSTNNCAACHNTISFRPDFHFDHAEVLGNCVSCHNGTIAQGEGPNHLQTSQNCAACHTVMSWDPTRTVDHLQIPLAVSGYCAVCHNGVAASGKPVGHVVTNLECGACHTTNTWLGADFDHSGITSGCFSCHNGSKAVGKTASHMPTSTVCEKCHTTGIGTRTPAWAPSLFDHTQMSVTTCQTCHNGKVQISTGIVAGQPTNHVPPIPSLVDCGVCHGNTPSAETWTTLTVSIAQLHAGLSVNNCLMCHAGQTFAGVPSPYTPMSTSGVSPTHAARLAPPHIPVPANVDCSGCHAAAYQSGGFGPATAMNAAKHAYVSSNCLSCHETGSSFYTGGGAPLQLRPADHLNSSDPLMVSGNCSQCHSTTDWNSSAYPAGHMPNPGNQGCIVCHTAAPNNYTTLATNSVLHTGIKSGCGQCHGGTTALTWYNNFTPKDGVLAPAHVPYLSGVDCGSCHASSSYAAGTFGPMNMTQAKHAFVADSCVTCHEAGRSFYMGAANPGLQGRPADHTSGQMVAPNDCSLCHTTANWNSTVLPAGHMPNPANQACTVCHTAAPSNYTTLAANSVLHTGISGGCGQCHGGTTALTWYNNFTPKDGVLTPAHIPYTSGTDCGSCHASSTYAAGTFGPMNMTQAKHAFVPNTCVSCHEAGQSFYMGAANPGLQGRPADHNTGQMVAPNDCSLCHTTANWNSTALPAGHMPNPGNQGCTVCHTAAPTNYTTLAANSVLHTGISSGCGQCHGGTTALTWFNNFTPKDGVLTPAHIPYSSGVDCGSCHASSTYAAGTFGPMNMTQAKHAFVATTCITCHEAGRAFYMGAANPGLQGRPADHTSGQMVAPNDCSLCHTTANWNSTALPAGHMPNPANQACTVCHTAAPTNYTTLAANSALHTGISSGCGQCHGGTTALTWYNNFTPKDGVLTPAHIPYIASTDCGSCHASSTYAAGTFGPMNMTQAKHAFVVTTCVTCHEAGRSFYMGAANPGLQGRPADHTSGQMVAPNDCSLCHTTANWNSTALPAGHMPNPGNQGCTVCHTAAPTNYTTLAANPVLHTGISSGCITCHGSPAGALTFYNNFSPKSAVLSPVHIPTATTPCEDCHSKTVFTAFSGTTMSSAKHTLMFATIGSSCDACHNRVTPALSFYGVSNLQTRPSEHSGNMKTEDCSSCHNTNNWDAGAQKRPAKSTTSTTTTATAAKVVVRPQVSSTVSSPLLQFLNPTASSPAAPPIVSTPLITGMPAAAAGAGAAAAGSGIMAAAGSAGARGSGFSHLGLSATCVSCHNGVTAAGKGPRHVVSDNNCANCHTTIAWLPARFDHRGITTRCSSCHNGVAAPGRSTTHIPTVLDCSSCHSTISWRPARFAHIGTLGNCQSCHNALTGLGKPQTHISTALDCAACHDTVSWESVIARPATRPAKPVARPGVSGRDK